MTALAYVGGELELFARAHNWKAYLSAEICPFLHGDVLEVSAGMGAMTRALAGCAARSWLCLEPDPNLAELLDQQLKALPGPVPRTLRGGLVEDLPETAQFDSILYVDVLEHIERDAEEVRRVSRKLARGGHLIVLSPAHAFLMSAFDRSIGHHRRYDATSLRQLAPPELELVRMRYLDSCGVFASLANRVMLRQSLPTAAQIAFWDQRIVPLSRRIDPWFAHRVGKSILAIWRKV